MGYRSVSEGSNRVRHKMILSLVSSVLFASVALGAPGASNYGAAAVVGPAKQIASPSIQCRTEYVTLWDTEYQEKEEQVCVTEYEKQCTQRIQRLCQPTTRQECHTEYENQCNTIYKNVCVQKFRTEYEPYTESECHTEYKQDCQFEWRGHATDKVWAPIEGTCQNVPYDECKDVQKTHAKQVAYQECNDVPEQKCVSVPKQVCVTVPDQVCTSEPLTECQDVPRQQCHSEHKRSPSESADRSQRRFATRLQSMHRSLSLSTTSNHQSRICSAMAFLPFPPRLRPRSSLQETSKSSRMPPTTIGLFSHKSRSNSRNFSCNGDTKCI